MKNDLQNELRTGRLQHIWHSVTVSLKWVVMLVVMMATIATVASACPACDEGDAATNAKDAGLSAGFSYSVLALLATPIFLIGTGATVVLRARKRMQHGPDGN